MNTTSATGYITGTGAAYTVMTRKSPADVLRALEWGGWIKNCPLCGNYDPDMSDQVTLRALPKSMIGHKPDCRWHTEMKPRIAYLELSEKGG